MKAAAYVALTCAFLTGAYLTFEAWVHFYPSLNGFSGFAVALAGASASACALTWLGRWPARGLLRFLAASLAAIGAMYLAVLTDLDASAGSDVMVTICAVAGATVGVLAMDRVADLAMSALSAATRR